jgi:hypothetical protein
MNGRYDRDLQRGLEFQDHVSDLFAKIGFPLSCYSSIKRQKESGENFQGIEIKFDNRWRETGNLFIEYRERSGPESEWHDSGVLGKESMWGFVIGDYEGCFFFSLRLLQLMLKSKKYETRVTETAEGFLLPYADAEKYACFFLPSPITVPFSQRNII